MVGRDISLENRPVDRLCRIVLGVDVICDVGIASCGASAAAEHEPEDHGGTHSALALASGDPNSRTVFGHLNFSADCMFGVRHSVAVAGGLFLSRARGVKTA